MIAFWNRRKPDITAAARALRQQGVDHERAKKRALHDQMRADLGLPAWEWAK